MTGGSITSRRRWLICLGRYPRKSTLSGGRCSAPLWFARTRRFRSQGPGFYRLAKELGSMSKGEDKVVFWKAEFRRVCTYAWK